VNRDFIHNPVIHTDYSKFSVEPPDEAAIAASFAKLNSPISVEQRRNILLKETDWTVLPDSPFTKEQQKVWKIYRQALRDITDQEGYPDSVVFPDKPVF
jgi:hypothetical protein